MRYYVQDIAVNYLKNLFVEPLEYAIHPSNLYGINEVEMKSGYRALLSLFGLIYRDIEADPASFSMLLRESVVPDAKDAAYTLSNQSLVRVPNLLFALGVWGELDADGCLMIGGNALNEAVKTLKITKAAALADRLSQYGLMISGMGKTVGAEGRVTLCCPDNRFLPAALHAIARAMLAINKGNPKQGKNLFYTLHAGLLETAPGKAPSLSLDAMCRTLSPERAEIARRLDRIISPHAKRKVRQGGIMRNDWGCVYTLTSNKRVVLTLNIVQQALNIKMNLAHLEGYTDLLDECSKALRSSMLSTWECGRCNPGCAGGFRFTYQSKAYNKCRGGAFQVPDVCVDQVDDCVRFLKKEVEASMASA